MTVYSKSPFIDAGENETQSFGTKWWYIHLFGENDEINTAIDINDPKKYETRFIITIQPRNK